ncbi:MAG: glycosyl transferase [Bacteroidetes bacterium GWD2_45_23]|nr:MAG: glycosyl transferase [Bacteroidetes bacterium GWC2_46_850]OFX80163.1 MAG: glycosyl transferase [Bacteroidetes bacterium GWC1_47_7]OFX86835.1 MAG: glycosyl transferase [Bacteroidetes bacterium GWD2_45_23]HBA99772.1 glycosyl transferase [Porphyromonadaceae bacterium]HCC18631.1 glycosyl transferase [Porphyromonadaceae bacterium]
MTTLFMLFWICMFLVFYTYIGYGIVLWMAVKVKELFSSQKVFELPEVLPEVTLFITAYNEEEMVDEKMANCLSLDYPRDKLHIFWVTDGSNDGTNERLANYQDVTIIFQPQRQGKSAAINRGMKSVTTPIVIFTDANTSINRKAVKEIVKAFTDSRTGCVAGEKRIVTEEKDVVSSGGEGAYWRYESALKDLDSRLCTAVGAAGELFAIRTSLFQEMREDTLLDDFVLSLQIAIKGYRIVYCRNAHATEQASLNMQEEEKRKVRIAAGGIQAIGRLWPLFNIFRYKCLSFQYISHRVLRWTITPVALLLLLPLNLFLLYPEAASVWLYQVFAAGQLLFYLLAVLGWILSKKSIRTKYLFIPYYFLFMNLNVFKGMAYLKNFRGLAVWEKAKRQ